MSNEIVNATGVRLTSAAQNSGTVSTGNSGSTVAPAQLTGQVVDSQKAAEPTPAAEPASSAPASTELFETLSDLNEQIPSVQRDLSFSIDETSGRTVVQVVDSDSGEVIRQIPSEEVLAIARVFKEMQEESLQQSEVRPGLLFSDST